MSIAGARGALLPVIARFNGDDDTRWACPANGQGEPCGSRKPRIEGLFSDAMLESLLQLGRRGDAALINARLCRVVDAQLLVHRGLVENHATCTAAERRSGDDRQLLDHGTGTVFWVTGMSAAGKSTLARSIRNALRRSGRRPLLLDGDDMRTVVAAPLNDERLSTEERLTSAHAYGLEERRRLAFKYSELARLAAASGRDVVCATISAFHDVRAANRRDIDRYVEIWVDAPLATLRSRDRKGIYSAIAATERPGVVGLDLPFEPPRQADYTVQNTAGLPELCHAARHIVSDWAERQSTRTR